MSAFSAKTKFGSGAAILVMSTSLVVLAGAVGLFAAMGDAAVIGLTEVGVAIAAITAASRLAGADGAASILTISSAMLVLAGAMAIYAALGNDAWVSFAKVAIGLVEMMAAVAMLARMSGDGLQAAWVISTLSGGMIKLAAACAIFNFVKWESLLSAGVALGGLIAVLLGAGALNSVFPMLSAGLTVLGTAFDKFASGALKLTGAMAIIGVLFTVCRPHLHAIINAAPDIQDALIAVVKVLCNTLIETAPQIAEAARVVIEAVVSQVWQMIKDLFAPLGSFEWWGEIFDADRPIGALGRWFGEIFDDDRPVGMAINGIKSLGGKIVEAFKSFFGIASPSKVMAENGEYVMLGVVEGLQNQSILARAKAAMHSAAAAIRNVFTTFWGIHSPSDVAASDAENILEGAILGIGDKTKQDELRNSSYNAALALKEGMAKALDEATALVQTKMTGLYAAYKGETLHLGNPIYQNGLKGARNAAKQAAQDNVPIPSNGGIKKPGNKTPPPWRRSRMLWKAHGAI